MSAVLYGVPSRIYVMHPLRRRRLLSLGFPEIGTEVSLSAVMVDDTYLGFMVDVRFQAGWRRSADGCLRINRKLIMYIEEYHFHVKVYMLNL